MTQPPQRIHTHQIDTRACSIISTKFSQNWEMRDLSGRDFGVDKIVERFQDSYATSEIMLLQIKGTETEIDINNPKFSIETKTLIYAERFTVPFILEKLEEGNIFLADIPKRFIPDCYQETISLGKRILEFEDKLNEKDFIRYIFNCQDIHTSICFVHKNSSLRIIPCQLCIFFIMVSICKFTSIFEHYFDFFRI